MDVSGPLFDGRSEAAVDRFLETAKYDVGAQALAEVATNLDRSIRQPTPYYETQITADWQGSDRVVHDRGIVYGPWLEGTSSRNRTTRFKGYASFRRATESVRERVPALVARALDRCVRGMGG